MPVSGVSESESVPCLVVVCFYACADSHHTPCHPFQFSDFTVGATVYTIAWATGLATFCPVTTHWHTSPTGTLPCDHPPHPQHPLYPHPAPALAAFQFFTLFCLFQFFPLFLCHFYSFRATLSANPFLYPSLYPRAALYMPGGAFSPFFTGGGAFYPFLYREAVYTIGGHLPHISHRRP